MGNDLPLAGNLAGSKKPEETSFNCQSYHGALALLSKK